MVGTEVASLYATMGADISRFQRSMGTVDNMLHSAGGKLGGFVGMLGTGLVTAAAAGAAGLAAAGAGIVAMTSKAASAEQSVADIAANMQLSAAETAKVAALVNDLGIDPKLKVTAGEAAAAIDMLGKNGLSLAEIFDGASRSTILLANSTKADFGTAADIATDVMQQFNIAASDMMTAVNGITGTTQNSKFDINDYKLALAQAGGVASSVGVSFDDFNATIAAISPLFASGSDAGTSFKTFLQRLTPSAKPAIKAMKDLGIITADGKNQFFDAAGNMKSMAEIAGTLQWAFAGLSDEQKNQYASTIFGTDAMRAAFALADAGTSTINDLKTAIGNTDAEQAAATRMDTLSGDYEIFLGVVDALSIKIGDKFIPAARDMLQWATDMVSGNADKIVGFFESLAGYIPKVSDAIAWGNQKWTELAALLQPVADGVGRLAHHVNLLWIGMKEADVGIFASGIRGLMFEFDRGLKAIIEYVASVDWAATLSAWSGAFMTWGGAIWENVSPYLRAYWSSLTGWVTDPARRQELMGALGDAWNWFSTWSSKVWSESIKPALDSTWRSLSGWVTDPAKKQDLWNRISGTWTGFTAWATTLWDEKIRPALVTMGAKMRIWIDSNYPQLGAWMDAITKFTTDAKNRFVENFPIMSQSVKGLSATLQTEIPLIGQEIQELVSTLFGGADGSGGGTFMDWITYAVENMTWKIGSLVKQIRIILDMINLVNDGWRRLFSGDFSGYMNLRHEFDNLWNQLQSANQGAPTPPGFASGGMFTRGGLAVVGERGPEIAEFPPGTYIHKNEDTVGMMGGGSRRIDVYVHAQNSMPTDRDAIRQLAIELQREMGMNGGRVVFG